MSRRFQKYPVTEKMMRDALKDEDVELFAHRPPNFCRDRSMNEGHRMLFTREVTWPGSSEKHPVHMGIYLRGGKGFLSEHLFVEWQIMMSDIRPTGSWGNHSFNLGLVSCRQDARQCLLYDMMWGSDDQESAFWDTAFHWDMNYKSYLRMLGTHGTPPHELAPTGHFYGGKGVGFAHMVPEIRRTWRIWREWLVVASVLVLAS